LSYHRASKTAPLGGAASMTVCTNDVALCHLIEHALPVAISESGPDAELLVTEVVELEHERIALFAVDTGVGFEVADEVVDAFSDDSPLAPYRCLDVSLSVSGIVLLLVRGPTGPAVVVELSQGLTPPGEFLRRFLNSAPAAAPHGTRLMIRTDVPC
jgi:hypothetical protein